MGALFVVVRVSAGCADTIEVYDVDQDAMDAAQGMLLSADYRAEYDEVQVFCVQPGSKGPYQYVSPLLSGGDVEEILKRRSG